MSVKNSDLFRIIEALAPKQLAEDWDNVGLQVGSYSQPVKRVLLTLDVNEAVVQEAEEQGVDLIIAHHPLLMKGIKTINTDNPQGQLIARLIKNNISVYAAHTNLDIADGGVNSVLADKLGLQQQEVLFITGSEKYVKLVVFVPVDHQETLIKALGDAGAGFIGNYSDCTFSTGGTGTFRPLAGTNPYIGSEGQLEQVAEMRIETIVPVVKLSKVVKAMLEAHPYEEVAYDVYPLNNQGPSYGLGRVGMLQQPMTLSDFVLQLKTALNLKVVKAGGDQQKLIKKVAVCGGSAAEFWPKALAKSADVYVSGDIKYHTAQDMVAAGLAFVDAGHYGSEVPVVEALYSYLSARISEQNIDVEILTTKSYQEPFVYL